MDNEVFETVVQQVVEDELNPVHFGSKERAVLYVLLIFVVISTASSIAILVLSL